MMAIMDSRSADRLAKFCGLLGSDADGERATAAAMATRLLRGCGWTWADLVRAATRAVPAARPTPRPAQPTQSNWQRQVAECWRRPELLTKWEVDFLAGLGVRRRLSEKQAARLAEILTKLREAGR